MPRGTKGVAGVNTSGESPSERYGMPGDFLANLPRAPAGA
jgi:hypothetical protein